MGSKSDSDRLTRQILLALVFGLIVGMVLYYTKNSDFALYLKPIGDIFIRLLKMMIVPLVISSIFMAVVNLGSPEDLGSLGLKSIIYYFCTTAIAAFFGLIIVNIIQPGVGLEIGGLSTEMDAALATKLQNSGETGLWKTIIGVFMDAIPTNPFEAMANMSVLQLIVFSLLFGGVALFKRSDCEGVIGFMDSLEKMSMHLVHGLMKFAPYGVFALMVSVIAVSGFDAISALGKYMAAVIIGLIMHFTFLLMVGSVRHKKSPLFMIKAVAPAMLTAFSTSSSAATLPITMASCEDNLGVDRKTAQFVLPLGATINMDGTALYESVAVIFIGQAYGLDLGLGTQIIIFLTASLAAVGAAAIPGAGLVTMSIVLTAVGFPLDGIGLILAVDRVLDMFRTMVNVFGDAMGTVVVDSFNKKSVTT